MKITDAITELTAVFLAWPALLVNSNFVRREREVTWKGSRTMIGAGFSFDDLIVAEGAKEYSFQAADGSLFQLWYLFANDGVTLENACLSFLHAVPYNPTDTSGHVPWIRFDYSPSLANGPTHDVCHLHMSMSKEIRIPASRFPTPAQFVELVAAWFYPSDWCAKRGTTTAQPWPTAAVIDAVNRARITHKVLSTEIGRYSHLLVP